MKITSDSILKAQSNQRDLDQSRSKTSQSGEKSQSDDILNISRENRAAASVSMLSFKEAVEKIEYLKSELSISPEKAFSAQSNINSEAVYHLL